MFSLGRVCRYCAVSTSVWVRLVCTGVWNARSVCWSWTRIILVAEWTGRQLEGGRRRRRRLSEAVTGAVRTLPVPARGITSSRQQPQQHACHPTPFRPSCRIRHSSLPLRTAINTTTTSSSSSRSSVIDADVRWRQCSSRWRTHSDPWVWLVWGGMHM